MINKIMFFLLVSLSQLTGQILNYGQVYDVSDTSIKKNYFNSDVVIESGNQILVGWDYEGGAVYSVDLKYVEDSKKYEVLFDEKNKYLFSTKVLNENKTGKSIILAGGYFSKCLCGILLRKEASEGVWDEIYFDEIDNPYVSNINCISTNSVMGDKNQRSVGRVFLGCNNGIILYSDDTAKTFSMSNIYTDGKNVSRINFHDEKIGFALIGADESSMNQLYFTNDYGTTWQLYYDFSSLGVTFKEFVTGNFIDSTVSMYLVGSKLNEGKILYIADINNPEEYHFINNEYTGTDAAPFVGISKLVNSYQFLLLDENGVLYNTKDNKVFAEIIKPPSSDVRRMKFNSLGQSGEGEVVGIGMDGLVLKYVPLTTNLQENSISNRIRLDYNPVTENLFIIDKENLKNYSIQIFNIMGIMTHRIETFSTEISSLPFSEQPDGMYFYRIETQNWQFCGKFLKY